MSIPTTTVVPTEVDVIIAGGLYPRYPQIVRYRLRITKGGATGCIIAARLAAADPTLEILIIEAGRDNLEDPDVVRPGMCLTHLSNNTSRMKAYTGIHSEHLAGRPSIVTAAQILGGGSSVNYLMYTRASASYVPQSLRQVVASLIRDIQGLRRLEYRRLGNAGFAPVFPKGKAVAWV